MRGPRFLIGAVSFWLITVVFPAWAGVFVDVAPRYGVNAPGYAGLAVYDYDQDGDEDILVGNEHGVPRLHENIDGIYRDIGNNVGFLAGAGGGSSLYCFAWGDFNSDGLQDLYAGSGNFGGTNRLYVHYDTLLPTSLYDFLSTTTACDSSARLIERALVVGTNDASKTVTVVDHAGTPGLSLGGMKGNLYGVLVWIGNPASNTGRYEVRFSSASGGLGRARLSAVENCIDLTTTTLPVVRSARALSPTASYTLTLTGTTNPELTTVLLGGVKASGEQTIFTVSKGSPVSISAISSTLYGFLPDISDPASNTGQLILSITNSADPSDTMEMEFNASSAMNLAMLDKARPIPNHRFVDEAASRGVLHDTGGGTLNAKWIDVNRDGVLDLWTGNYANGADPVAGRNIIYINHGTTFTEMPYGLGHYGGPGAVWVDIDQDGDLDLVTPEGFSRTAVFRNDGGTFTATKQFERGIPVVADFDGDGRFDVLIIGTEGANGPNYFYLNTGTDFIESTAGRGLGGIGWYYPVALDFDGDGAMDFYSGAFWPTRGLLLRNDGTGHFTDVADGWGVRTRPSDEPRAAVCNDFNGDGRMDLFLLNWGGGCQLEMNVSSASSQGSSQPVDSGSWKARKDAARTVRSGEIRPAGAEGSSYLKILITDSRGHWTRPGATVVLRDAGTSRIHTIQSVGASNASGAQANYVVTMGVASGAAYDVSVRFPISQTGGQPVDVGPTRNPLLRGLVPDQVGNRVEIREDGTVIFGEATQGETPPTERTRTGARTWWLFR